MKLILTGRAGKDLDKLDERIQAQIRQELKKLAKDPRSVNLKKYQAKKGQWRLKIGEYRAILEFDRKEEVVTVTRIKIRGKIRY
ncbi:MAG: type II toxin-antitoxin system RelE/ParE family toxin [Candidatus Eremiobacteraeota bacterium]|nr:type II toxin-antitoxin system RelE/ParE family toxin [Candidatus Eremiobacteraeota bacterium]